MTNSGPTRRSSDRPSGGPRVLKASRYDFVAAGRRAKDAGRRGERLLADDGIIGERYRVPLTGIRVLDFGRYIAGPYCGALLADYGADVIRIEAPGGNEDRSIVQVACDGSGAVFLQMNRAKRWPQRKAGRTGGTGKTGSGG